jgi:exopolysaccharide biosynthesis predicted pyruvyltransferase EpsI
MAIASGSMASILLKDDIWNGRQLIRDLQAEARAVLDPLILPGSSVAIVDYPNNPNVGDSLIWLGEVAYLKSRSVSVDYVCDVQNYSLKQLAASIKPESIMLVHGGGNFGTLWPELHQFRLNILRDFPGRKIIQFAQSIHFDNPVAVDETARAISAHGNYVFLARDQATFDFAITHFDCQVFLCPDMAFFIGALESSAAPLFDRFILSRGDHEKMSDWLLSLADLQKELRVDVSDWLQSGVYERFIWRAVKVTKPLRERFDSPNKLLFLLRNHLAQQRLKCGKALLERGRVVISDRLHVHILSIFLNKPHALMDNSSGKICGLHQTWTSPYQGVNLVQGLKDAFSTADYFDARIGPNA